METVAKSNTYNIEVGATGRPVFTGIVTGQIAGLIMAVVVMAVFTLLGKGPLYPVQVIGSALFGGKALEGFHFGALIAGLVLHQAGPSLLWGYVFGQLAKKVSLDTTVSALFYGVFLGVFSMVGPYLLIPMIMNALQGVDYWAQEVPIFWDWAAHLVFGASFVLYPFIRKKLSK